MENHTGGKTRHEESAARGNSTTSGEDAKPDGTDSGRFSQGDSEFRAGVEERTCSCRTSGPPYPRFEKPRFQEGQALLADAPLSCGEQGELPRMAVRCRTSVLVHQWNDLRGYSPGKLEEEDENMSKVRGLPIYICC